MIAPVVGKFVHMHYDRPIHYKRRITILNKISNKKLTKNDQIQLIDLKLVPKNKPVELGIDRLLREYALYTLNSCILYYFLQY